MKRSQLFRNISGSWLGLGADALTGFILTRVILRAVGSESFGLWVMVSGLLGYYGLLDLGTRNGIIRYVARHNAQKDHDGLSSVLSTALAGYLGIGSIVLLLSALAAWQLEHLFTFTDPSALHDGRILVLVLGVGAAMGFPLSAFGGTLEGLQHFVRIGAVQAAASLTRAVAVIVALWAGFGIVTVGVLTVAFNVAAGVANALFVVQRVPELRIALRHVRRDTLRTLAGFGLVTFWAAVANRLRFESDALVIGKLIGLHMVSVFAIGARIITYSTDAVAVMAGVFTPAMSAAHAVGDHEGVRRMTLTGNRMASLLSFPAAVVLLFFGRELITAWVGAEHVASYQVIAVLAAPMALYASHFGSTRMMYGVGAHKTLAMLLLAEGAVNLVLSIALAPRFGLLGVAWGTAIPLYVTSLVALPFFACRAANIPLLRYWREAQIPALLRVAPVVLLFVVLEGFRPEPGILEAFVRLLIGGSIYAAIVLRSLKSPAPALAL